MTDTNILFFIIIGLLSFILYSQNAQKKIEHLGGSSSHSSSGAHTEGEKMSGNSKEKIGIIVGSVVGGIVLIVVIVVVIVVIKNRKGNQ